MSPKLDRIRRDILGDYLMYKFKGLFVIEFLDDDINSVGTWVIYWLKLSLRHNILFQHVVVVVDIVVQLSEASIGSGFSLINIFLDASLLYG